ncbi:hypothetical protein DAI22_07g109200 [Oryza sativa Japonica Group]|nr:hypothetical protein DAI22_07g109200 [Oryza sativa Japonica Group]
MIDFVYVASRQRLGLFIWRYQDACKMYGLISCMLRVGGGLVYLYEDIRTLARCREISGVRVQGVRMYGYIRCKVRMS